MTPLSILTATGPYGLVVLGQLDVQFESTEDFPEVTGTLGWTVPTGQTVTGTVTIVPGVYKTQPPLVG